MNENELSEVIVFFEERISNISNKSLEEIMEVMMSPSGRILIKNDRRVEMIYKFVQASLIESEEKRLIMFKKNNSIEELSKYDILIKNIMYRISADYIDEELYEMIRFVLFGEISIYTFLVYAGYFNDLGDKTIIRLSDILFEMNERINSIYLYNASIKMFKDNSEIPIKLAEKYIRIGMREEAENLLQNTRK